MHELSIAESLIEQVERAVRADGAGRVTALTLRIGALAGVDADALRFGFEVAAQGTLLEGAALDIQMTPVVVYCPACDAESTLAGLHPLACPRCGRPTADLRGGRELMVDTVEVLDEAPSA